MAIDNQWDTMNAPISTPARDHNWPSLKLNVYLKRRRFKMRSVKQIFLGLSVFLILAWTTLGQNGVRLSKDQVIAALDSIDRGLTNRNAAAVVANFATNAVITVTIQEDHFKDSLRHTTTEYREILESSLKEPGPYRIKRSDVSIELSPGGKTATVVSTLVEDYNFEGKLKHGVSKETATFQLIGAKALLTSLHSEVNIK